MTHHLEKAHQQHGSHCCHSHGDSHSLTPLAPSQAHAQGQQTAIRIMQMDCPVEENLIRKKLASLDGVRGMEFNLMQRVLTVTHQPEQLENILSAIRSLGFEPQLNDAAAMPGEKPASWWPLIVAGLAAVLAEAADWMAFPVWLSALLALVALLTCGLTTYKKGWIALRNVNLNINALMSIAVTGAILLGQWPEAAMVMVLFTLAERIEALSLDRARNAISALMALTPDLALVQQLDGRWQNVATDAVATGSIIRVKPGERIGLDGELVRGATSINQAPVTGESLPVDKIVGDRVYAGTINQMGEFDYRVTAAASDTTLARIIRAVEQAQGAKAPMQRFVDRFARIYTPLVFVLALAVAVIPPLVTGGEWQTWIYKALVLLVIACPCALVISTPVTIVSGLTAAARRGILIKGGVYLEQGRKLRWLALDKTGTVTQGKPVLTQRVYFPPTQEAQFERLALSLATRSDHPVSQALVSAIIGVQPAEVSDFAALTGRGVRGTINGQRYGLGNLRLVSEAFACPDAIARQVAELEAQGNSVILLHSETQVLALFTVADTVKESSREAIAQLHQLGVSTLMLSGDNPHTVAAVARAVGIDVAHGSLLPEDKQRAVQECTRKGLTGMVGDGINDAPALAVADIGFAMGAMGTDTAIETADVALMDDDLRKIPAFIRLSRRTHRVLIANIVLALGIKALFLALTLAGLGTLWMAVFADVGASLLVVANGLRLLRAGGR